MLSRADDYPVHQTAEPIANPSTGDRNFYDRYFFNGYSRDGEVFFAVALGVYPNRSVMDGAVSVIHRGRQHVVRASRVAPLDRVETRVGPITVQVVEPLRRLKVRVEKNEWGIEMNAEFTTRGPAIEEPRFTRRANTRLIMDYTRLTQHGSWQGSLTVDGKSLPLKAERVWGSRDRSWGVRPVGEPEGGAQLVMPQFFWLWAPLNFPSWVTHFDVNEESDGRRWHEMGLVAPVAAGEGGSGEAEVGAAGAGAAEAGRSARALTHRLSFRRGTRHAERAEIELDLGRDRALLSLKPLYNFYMSGLGYLHPDWGHGTYHGAEAVTGEHWLLDELDQNVPLYLHVQAVCEAKLSGHGGPAESGMGVLEQLILGPHEPYGFTGMIGGAP